MRAVRVAYLAALKIYLHITRIKNFFSLSIILTCERIHFREIGTGAFVWGRRWVLPPAAGSA